MHINISQEAKIIKWQESAIYFIFHLVSYRGTVLIPHATLSVCDLLLAITHIVKNGQKTKIMKDERVPNV